MSAKTASKFKRPDEYETPGAVVQGAPARVEVREVFFRLKLMPASLVQYAVEQVTVIDDVVLDRQVITERDILPITLSKIEDALIAQVKR